MKKLKIVCTSQYTLAIDEEAEITLNSYYVDIKDNPLQQIWFWQSHIPTNKKITPNFRKIIAYYPLTPEAKELNLPLLPKYFLFGSEKILLAKLQSEYAVIDGNGLEAAHHFGVGYKAAQQSNKQFSLKDVRNRMRDVAGRCLSKNMSLKDTDEIYDFIENIIQSLSTQQLPKDFILGEGNTIEEQIKNGSYVY